MSTVATGVESTQTKTKRFLDVNAAAERVGLHRRTILREINRSNLPAMSIGRHFFVQAVDLDKWIVMYRARS